MKKKKKKLKILCNINDVIRPIKSSTLYGISDKAISFKEYSKYFEQKEIIKIRMVCREVIGKVN